MKFRAIDSRNGKEAVNQIVAILYDGFGGEFPLTQSQLDQWNKTVLPMGWMIMETR